MSMRRPEVGWPIGRIASFVDQVGLEFFCLYTAVVALTVLMFLTTF